MSRPDQEMKLMKPSWVSKPPAGSPSISRVSDVGAWPLAGGSCDQRRCAGRAVRCLAAPAGPRHDHVMHAADIHVVGQPAVLDVERVAAGHVAVGDQHALGAAPSISRIGLDRVGAAAHVGRDVGRHVAHAGMEDELACAAPWKRAGVVGEARREAVVERQHLVRLGLAPPFVDHRLQPLGLASRRDRRSR